MANREFNGLLKSECTKAAKLANILTGRNDAYVSAWSHNADTDTNWSKNVDCEISFRDTDNTLNFCITITVMMIDRRGSYAHTFGPDGMQYINAKNAKDYAGAFPLPCDCGVKEEETDMMDKDSILQETLTDRAIEMTKKMIECKVIACGAFYAISCDDYITCERETSKIVHAAIGLISESMAADIMEDVSNATYKIFDADAPLYIVPDSETKIFKQIYRDARLAGTKADLVAVYERLSVLVNKEQICRETYKVLMSALNSFWGMISTPTDKLSVQDAQEIVSKDFGWTVTDVLQGDKITTIFCDWRGETKRLEWSWDEHRIIDIETI